MLTVLYSRGCLKYRMVRAQVERIIREKLAVLMYNQGKGELITRHASQLQLITILSVVSLL